MLVLDRAGRRILISADAYSLEIGDAPDNRRHAPYARLCDADGRIWSDLSLLSSVHSTSGSDETYRIEGISAHELTEDGSAAIELRVDAVSSLWPSRTVVLRCLPDRIELRTEITGSGPIDTVTLLGGRGAMPDAASGEFRSEIGFAGLLAPAATEPVQFVRPAVSAASLAVVGDADPGRLNAVFSPPPLAYGFSREAAVDPTTPPDGDWLAAWLRSPVEELGFTAFRYLPLDGGFQLQLDYEGHTVADGAWVSPTLVIMPVATGWTVLDEYRDDLVTHGFAPLGPTGERHAWWSEPIFCGWGAQCARSAAANRSAENALAADLSAPVFDPADPFDELLAPVHSRVEVEEDLRAPAFARADVYDQLLSRLSDHGIEPGTIVIDDRWQSSYGTGEVDTDHWPDLRGWIDARHAEGRKVLLWWKAWDPEGVPAEECVRNAIGEPVSVDAGSAAYRARLSAIVEHLLSPEGLDADGFKIDFTQRGPSGRSLTGTPGVWGIAALHLLLRTIADAARATKPDALLIAHAVHPSFADICDMVRLNDVSKQDAHGRPVPVIDQLAMRHGVATRALPHHLVDTDQWPMPNRAEWLAYSEAQPGFGVPALYYVESMDRTGEVIGSEDLHRVAASWQRYRDGIR
ncbi:hypothetical protein [Naasia lichenicola]|uniref:Glycoside hydrolase n=1 Tax=Naasia lichenicola TaxID=2565933 RepID=A0A4S4FHJ0_9MICO|nr:hypothetical protein [Naasia lichenicola]THG29254.1 hypothetical protein E6C64_11020 [Naasia lichenicola]